MSNIKLTGSGINMYCNFHRGREGIKICKECGKAICKQCSDVLGDTCLVCYEDENRNFSKRLVTTYGIAGVLFIAVMVFYIYALATVSASFGEWIVGLFMAMIYSFLVGSMAFSWKKVMAKKISWLAGLGYVGIVLLFCLKIWGVAFTGWYYAIKQIRADLVLYKHHKSVDEKVNALKMLPKYEVA